MAETLVLSTTWPPSLASRVAPASPCSSPSGSVGTPMSAALFLPSRPVFTTTAASASEASSPAMFSAETENRSHSAAAGPLALPRARRASRRSAACPSPGRPGRRSASPARGEPPRPVRYKIETDTGPARAAYAAGQAAPSCGAWPSDLRGQDGHVEPVLQRGVPGHAEPVQQAAVGRAAAEEDVLAGVDGQAVPAERAGRAAQPRPGLEQGDVGARLGERDRCGDPGQSPADHREAFKLIGTSPPGRCTATMAFSPVDKETRLSRTAAGCAAIRSSSRR